MTRRFILGSGINGLLARTILGDSWTIIPFGRSRFYSYTPAIADNFIIRSDAINSLSFIDTTSVRRYQRAISYCGELIFSDESFAKLAYIDKLFGANPHPAAQHLLRTELVVYRDDVAAIYNKLQTIYTNEIAKSIEQFGELRSITDHALKLQNTTLEYDYVISTIPLYSLYQYLGHSYDLPSRDMWYYHVRTPSLDFEGARQVFVSDKPFDFHKVTQVGGDEYVFECLRDLVHPTDYLGAFLKGRLDVINQTSIERAIPVGQPPSLVSVENIGIYPVGCHAQWDYFMDVSSSIKRLNKLSGDL